MKYGVTAEGFISPSIQDIITDIETEMNSKGYADFRIDPYSVEGVFLGIIADRLLNCWEGVEQVYYSRYLDTSEGIQLDRHGKNDNIPRILGKYATTTLKFTTESEVTIPKRTYVRIRDTNFNFYTTENLTISANSSGEVQAVAEMTGSEYNCNTNAITEMTNGIIGVTSVTNIIPATGGDGIEGDSLYRERLKIGKLARGGSNVDAIRLALTQVPLVNAALVLDNYSDVVNEFGIKSGYIRCYVDGIKSLKVAEAIFKHKSAGIGTEGKNIYKVTSESGQEQTIHFEDFKKKTLYIKINLFEGTVDFATIEKEIKNRVKDYVDSCSYPTPKTIVLNQITSKVYSISDSITIVEAEMGLEKENLQKENIKPIIGTILVPEIEITDGRL